MCETILTDGNCCKFPSNPLQYLQYFFTNRFKYSLVQSILFSFSWSTYPPDASFVITEGLNRVDLVTYLEVSIDKTPSNQLTFPFLFRTRRLQRFKVQLNGICTVRFFTLLYCYPATAGSISKNHFRLPHRHVQSTPPKEFPNKTRNFQRNLCKRFVRINFSDSYSFFHNVTIMTECLSSLVAYPPK